MEAIGELRGAHAPAAAVQPPAGPGAENPRLNEIIRGADKLLGRVVGENIELHTELAPASAAFTPTQASWSSCC
jgi:hypothetical protein